MQIKNTALLLLIATSLLSGCNDESKISLVANSDYFLYGEVSNDSLFVEPNLEQFTDLYNSNLNFVIYYTIPGCSACDEFAPKMEEYSKNSHQLIVKLSENNFTEIDKVFGSKLFSGNSRPSPSVLIKENNDEIYTVDYASYMKTYNVFKRHMNSRYKNAKYSYFSGEITTKSWINREFTYLQIINNEVYKNNVLLSLKNTQKDVIFSFIKDTMHASIIGRNDKGELYSKDEAIINEKITQETLSKFL